MANEGEKMQPLPSLQRMDPLNGNWLSFGIADNQWGGKISPAGTWYGSLNSIKIQKRVLKSKALEVSLIRDTAEYTMRPF